MARLVVELRDYETDKKQSSYANSVVTSAANFDATLADALALRDAILNVTLGGQSKYQFVSNEILDPQVLPASPVANVTLQWVVEYVDTVTGSIYHDSIGTAETSDAALRQPNSNFADLAEARWVAFTAAFESWVESPDDNPVAITNIVLKR
jgi:hypothetical protein